MTLSTEAEHAASRDADRLADALEAEIQPMVRAEEFVLALEGTEDDPAVVDAEAEADELREAVYDATERKAKAWGENHVAGIVAESFAASARDLVLEMLHDAPTVEAR